MRDRLKVLETVAAEAALHPILPASARGAIAELAALCRELVDRIEQLETQAAMADAGLRCLGVTFTDAPQ